MKYFILLILSFCQLASSAQTKISGVVIDASGKGIPGANVFLKNTYDGTTTDASGKFSFTTTEAGEQVIAFSMIGFQNFEKTITLNTSPLEITASLKESMNELRAVTISAGAFEASDEKKVVILRPLDIVTTAGANGDIYGALQTLPGSGVVGEKEGQFVRGGDANESKTFIDGLLVDNPYFTSVPDVPQRGRFSPFLFKGTSFSTGGYSAQYGQAMSSALILESQDLAERTLTSIGIMSVGANAGHTQRWKNTSVSIFGGYTDLTPYFSIVKQNREWIAPPKVINGSFILRHKFSKTGIIKAFFNYTTSELGINFPDTSDALLERQKSFSLKNNNIFSSLSVKEIFAEKWTVFASASFSTNKDDILVDTFPVNSKNDLFASRLTISRSLGELSVLRFGGEFQTPILTTTTPYYSERFEEKYSAAYAEGDIYLTSKVVARLGLRSENSELLERINFAPRVSLAYKTGKFSQFSFAYGKFYQVPQKEFTAGFPDVSFQFENATHYIANFQSISDLRTFRVEAYYKKYDNLSRYLSNSADNSGYGYAKGFEFFYRDKKSLSRSDFWLSYSFLDTKRLYRDFPTEAMPAFSANHTASLVFKYWFPKLSLSPSLTYIYSSGRPYYNPNNSKFLSDRTKDYHNVSLNFSYLTTIAKSFTVVVFSVSNVLGIENIYSYNYSPDGSRRIPVMAPSSRMFFAGIFINIGSQKDDSEKFDN